MRGTLATAFAVTFSLFIELVIFRQDIQARIIENNREDNALIIEAANKRIDDEIAEQQAEIARLNTLFQDINNTARATAVAQIEALDGERVSPQQRVNALEKELTCQEQNLLAEKTGETRCDNVKTVSGEGKRYAFALGMVESIRAKLAEPQARLRQIDAELARLHRDAPDGLPVKAQERLQQIDQQRTQAMKTLEQLRTDRDAKVLASIQMDPRQVPMPEGMLVSAKALYALILESTWMRMAFIFTTLTLIMIEFTTMMMTYIKPVPESIMMMEAGESETAVEHSVDRTFQEITDPVARSLKARGQIAEAKSAAGERIDALKIHSSFTKSATANIAL